MAAPSSMTRRFAPSAADPDLCQYCWSRKAQHEPLGECPGGA